MSILDIIKVQSGNPLDVKKQEYKEMKETPEPKEANEIRALIKVKIDIYGLTSEDIEDLRRRAQDMITHRTEVTNE